MKELVSKKNLEQIHRYNSKVKNWYARNEQKDKKLKARIEKLKKQIDVLENKKYHNEQSKLNHKEYAIITSPQGNNGKTLDGEIEFYENVIAHGYVVDHDTFKTTEVYQHSNGKWYEIGVRIPATFDQDGKCNGMDEDRAYFKQIEVEIK